MQGLILAAGRGSRLGSKTTELPKCLLDIGRRPLIEYQLEMLAEAGIAPICMVVGYCADEIKEVVGIQAEYIENQKWNTTNSLYSFWLAKDWVKDSLVVLNSDVLFHPKILERVLSESGDAFAYDSNSGNAIEHMKVKVRNGILVDMRKDLSAKETSGENVGILKFNKESIKKLYEKTDELISKNAEKTWFPLAVKELARDQDIYGIDIAGLAWGEIDSSYDLEKARKQILPEIEKTKSSKKQLFNILKIIGGFSLFFLSVFLSYKVWVDPPQILWQTINLEGIPSAEISSENESQDWWLLGENDSVNVIIFGPTTLHIDTRAFINEGNMEKTPYVLEIILDDSKLNWHKHFKKESVSWKNENNHITKLSRIEMNIEEGSHELDIRLIAAKSNACLIRIKKVLSDEVEEE